MSWIVVDKESGEVALETFSSRNAYLINVHSEVYEAIPVREYLYQLGQRIKAHDMLRAMGANQAMGEME